MKKPILIYLFCLGCLLLTATEMSGQALVSTDNTMNDVDPSAMLQVYSNDRGLMIPTVLLTYDEGKKVAPSITVTPADGLIIFHDGSNNIEKGIYYYDAVLQEWARYSDLSQTQTSQSLDNFAEMYESRDFGNGTSYDLSMDYFIPWSSGQAGLRGTAFEFLDSETVSLAPGVQGTADRYHINSANSAIYSVVVSATIASTTPFNTTTGQLFINGTQVPDVFFRHTFQLKDKPTSLKTSGNIQLNPGDKIDFRFISNDKNNGVQVENLNIRLSKLGEI